MTPQELCSLASKINAAVPGLVPEHALLDGARDVLYVDECLLSLRQAAAMMLGWVEAWFASSGIRADVSAAILADMIDIRKALRDYLTTQLPEAP